jgi:hypothetical protein
VHIELITGNVIRATESAWVGLKKALSNCKPSVTDLKLVDSVSNREFMSGRTGLAAELRRRETLAPLIVGAAVLVYAVIGTLSFAKDGPWRFLLGAIPGVVAAIVALTRLPQLIRAFFGDPHLRYITA